MLWQSTLSGSSLQTIPSDTINIDSNNSFYVDYGVGGDAQPGDYLAASENFNGPPLTTQSPTAIVPLVSPSQMLEHGQEFTIRGVHGYIFPLSTQTADQAGVTGSPTFAIWRIGVGEIEIPRTAYVRLADTTAAPAHNFGVLTRRHLGDRLDLKSRFWYLRTFWLGCNQVQNFSVAPAAQAFTFVASQCMERSPFAIHLPRFNFKVHNGRIPAVFFTYLGSNGGNIVTTNISGSTRAFAGESKATINVSSFLRAFITK